MPNIGRQRTGASTVHIPWRFVSLSRTAISRDLCALLLSVLGGIIAVVTAFAFPAGYAVIGHLKQADQLARKAELTAARVASHIQAPITRHSDPDQLAAISELLTASAVPLVQRIVDPHGVTVLEKGIPLPWPTFTREAPVLASGALIGRLEISASMRPLIEEVAVVALGALVLAVGRLLRLCRAAAALHRRDARGAGDRKRQARAAEERCSTRRWTTWSRGW